MSTNPSVSATSPGPRVPGPPAAEHAGPWESQHLCSSPARRAGGGVRPPALPQPHRPRPSQPAHREQRVERMGAGVLRRSRKSNDKAGGATTPAPRPTPTRPRDTEHRRRVRDRQRRARVSLGGVRGPQPQAGLQGGPGSAGRSSGGRWVWGREWYLWRRWPSECDLSQCCQQLYLLRTGVDAGAEAARQPLAIFWASFAPGKCPQCFP